MLYVGTWAADPPPPIEHYTRAPSVSGLQLSPSGNRLAWLVLGPTGYSQLGVVELDPFGKGRIVASYSDADVASVHWVNDERLVFEAYKRGAELGPREAGTFAVNHDGSELRQLIAWRGGVEQLSSSIAGARLLPYGWFFRSTVDDGSSDVIVYQEVRDHAGDLQSIQLSRVDTRNGTLRNLNLGTPQGSRAWLLDSKGEPRLITAYRKGRNWVYWREGDAWKVIAEFDPLHGGFTPWRVDDDGQITVLARSGSDVRSLYRFDLANKRIEPEPLVRVAGFDLDPMGEHDGAGRLVGLHFVADRPMSYWFDE